MSNEITAYFKGTSGVSESVYQYDYGMILIIDGPDLTAPFEVHFEHTGGVDAVTAIGQDNRVTIPNACLALPGRVTAYIYDHTGQHDGETAYVVRFQVMNRARPVDEVTDEQDSAISKAIALLAEPIDNIETIVNEALAFTGPSIKSLDARITNLATLSEGSTTGDAELIDARVVGDKVYGTLHQAIDTEISGLKNNLNGLNDSVYCNTLRDVAQYPFGSYLANAYVWVATDVYVPKGTGGKLVCLNYSSAEADGRTLHVILLKKTGENTFEVLSDQTITSLHSGVNVYIPKSITKFNDVYIGFYSRDNGMVYQSTGRTTPFTRYEYNSQSVGDTVTVSGAYNLDFSFALFTSIEPSEPVEPAYPVIVDVNGQGKYTSILDAINGEPESTVIYVYPGVYEQDMTECLRKRIILIGADRNQCIIRDTDGRYGHHALYVSCGYFENLTIEEPYVSGVSNEVSVSELGAYAVHVDTDEDYAVGKQIEFHHCNIRSDFFPAMGVGLRKDMTLILNDCLLENNQVNGRGDYSDEGTLGALYFHDSNGTQGDQYVILKNNVFRSKLKYAMCPYQVYRNPQNNRVHCDFINNVLYSDIGKYADTVWFRGDPFNPSTGIFSIGIGYGNSIESLNN